jgi:hypothetical protein
VIADNKAVIEASKIMLLAERIEQDEIPIIDNKLIGKQKQRPSKHLDTDCYDMGIKLVK